MDDDRTICLQHDQDDAEEALSLTDFPLDHHSSAADSQPRTRRSSSEPPDFFEFLKDNDIINTSHVMCSADDIIVCGKLMPFKGQPATCCPNPTRNQEETKLPLRSRSDSSSIQKGAPAVKLTRSSRSVDGTSYVRGTIGKAEIGLSESKRPPGTKPRWYVYMMMFGVAKFPTEMELRDMRTRQLRRTPTSKSVSSVDGQVAGGDNFPARHHRPRTGWGGSWKLLQALSCKNYASVAVATTSFEGFISNHYSYE